MNARRQKRTKLKKKSDSHKALLTCRIIYDGHFYVKINPI